MGFNKILLLLIFSLGCAVSYAEVYQWTDEEGTTHFSDKPIDGKTKKLDLNLTPMHDKESSTSNKEVEQSSTPDARVKIDEVYPTNSKNESAGETKTKTKSREELTEELIKAREIREAKRKKEKEEEQLELIQCQEEKTKLALMKNEIKEYDKKLKKMSRSERTKSNEYIKRSDLEIRMKHQKDLTYELCN